MKNIIGMLSVLLFTVSLAAHEIRIVDGVSAYYRIKVRAIQAAELNAEEACDSAAVRTSNWTEVKKQVFIPHVSCPSPFMDCSSFSPSVTQTRVSARFLCLEGEL